MERDFVFDFQFSQKPLQNYASGFVIRHTVSEAGAFRGRILHVRPDGINIEPPAGAQKAAAAGRFKCIIAGVEVDQTQLVFIKRMVFDLLDDHFRRADRVVINKAAKLGFNSENTFIHKATSYLYRPVTSDISPSDSSRNRLSRVVFRSKTPASMVQPLPRCSVINVDTSGLPSPSVE